MIIFFTDVSEIFSDGSVDPGLVKKSDSFAGRGFDNLGEDLEESDGQGRHEMSSEDQRTFVKIRRCPSRRSDSRYRDVRRIVRLL